MLKLFGALLLTGCGLTLGLGRVRSLRQRAEALEGWGIALELICAELEFALPPTYELFLRAAKAASEPAKTALHLAAERLESLGEQPFEDIWARALECCVPPLKREDLECLARLGSVLGRYDGESQRRAAERARKELSEREHRIREELRRSGKTWIAAGLSLGAFVTILLL